MLNGQQANDHAIKIIIIIITIIIKMIAKIILPQFYIMWIGNWQIYCLYFFIDRFIDFIDRF